MKKHKTNVQQLTKMMNFSEFGALKQAFIMTAIEKYAQQVEQSAADVWEAQSFISFDAWKGCAAECLNELEAHYASEKS